MSQAGRILGCSRLMGCDVRRLGAEGVVGAGFGVFGWCWVVVRLVSRWGGVVLAARGWVMFGTWRVGSFRVCGLWG